jgi:hypothetical protein
MRRARLYFFGPAVLLPSSARSRRVAGHGKRRPPTGQPHPPRRGVHLHDRPEGVHLDDDQRARAAVITPAMPLDRVLTALRHCTDRDLRAMFAHCQQRADEATETGYVGAGALFAALADLVMAERYDREQAGRAVDEALKGWNHNSDVGPAERVGRVGFEPTT